jgi:hypothetical protein
VSAELIAERAQELAAILAEPLTDAAARLDAVGRVGELRRLIDAVGVELAGDLETLREHDPEAARRWGERSPAMVFQAYAGLDASEATAWCRVGAALQPQTNLQGEVLPARHEALAAAMAGGRIRVGGAERLLTTLAEISPFASPAECLDVERFLIEQASGLTDRQFARVCRAIPSRFVPDDGAEREEWLRARSGVAVRNTPDGLVRWIVTMHPEAAGFLKAAVDARTAPRRQPAFSDRSDPVADADRRPLPQKRLDALVSIARESLAHDSGRIAGTSVTMTVTVPLDALRTGLGEAQISGIDEPISAATARRLAADAGIIPAVLGSESERLDLGREVRLATESQRRALELRDQGCTWWSCTAPAAWCEVAHIIPWFDGGGTDLDNLILLCPFHHRCFDLEGWQLEVRDGVRYFIPPPWVDSAQTPRRAGPLPIMGAA